MLGAASQHKTCWAAHEEDDPDPVDLREARADDLPLLAELNRQLIQDQQSPNPMSVAELEERMRGWLLSGYRAIIFELDSKPVAYALFRRAEGSIHLRQFFVLRDLRRQGVGRRAFEALRRRYVPPDVPLTLEVLVDNRRGIAFWRALGFQDRARSLWLPPSSGRQA